MPRSAIVLVLLVVPALTAFPAPAGADPPLPLVLVFEGDVLAGLPEELVLDTPVALDDRLHAFTVPEPHERVIERVEVELRWGVFHDAGGVYAANDFDYALDFEGGPLGWAGAASAGMPERSTLWDPVPGDYAVRVRPFAVVKDHYTLTVTLHPGEGQPGSPKDRNKDGFVVVAVVDTGVNPYHDAFAGERDPRNADADDRNDVDFARHPSRYLAGYPETARALPLTLDGSDYASSLAADAALWSSVATQRLYWVPGTKIVGAWSFAPYGDVPILDENGHGTATASLAAGNPGWQVPAASCPECLLVVAEDFGALAWAAQQPWIDVVSNSWGTVGNLGLPPPAATFGRTDLVTRAAAERGQTILFASGNGFENGFLTPEPDWESAETGPAWTIRVGAVSGTTGRPIVQDGFPVEVSSYGTAVRAAGRTTLNGTVGFGGTSAATPYVASAFGRVLLEARRALEDRHEGARPAQVVALGEPGAGALLADGKLTRAELREVVLKTAVRPNPPQGVDPPPEAAGAEFWLAAGYGLSNVTATERALEVLRGHAPMPDRSDVEPFAGADRAMRLALWGPFDEDGDGDRDGL